jgi:branched-chain amino acid transport system ATP-binding protein
MLLALEQVTTYYGQMRILEEISLQVDAGELVCLLGGNASGKSTTLKTILGLVRPRAGRVLLEGEDVTARKVPERIARGLAIVPENRRLFGSMTVRENLELGAILRPGQELAEDLDRVHTLFPRLHERRDQLAGTLSGGEQQMAAIGRGLMGKPEVLMLDEPSLGLAPILVDEVFRVVTDIVGRGVTVLLVEQNVHRALEVATTASVIENGRVVLSKSASEMASDPNVRSAYLGL